jgi:hypothetical protein
MQSAKYQNNDTNHRDLSALWNQLLMESTTMSENHQSNKDAAAAKYSAKHSEQHVKY